MKEKNHDRLFHKKAEKKKKTWKLSVLAGAVALGCLVSTGNEVYASPKLVVDNAQLLEEDSEKELEQRLAEITEQYQCMAAVVTTDSLDGKSPMDYTDDFYNDHDYGVGADESGLMLMVSMEDRDWWISTKGYGIEAFTDYGIEQIGEEIVPLLGDEDYEAAFFKFADLTEAYLEQAQNGEPYDIGNQYEEPMSFGMRFLISAGAGAAAALIFFLIFLAQLKSVGYQSEAKQYVRDGSFHMNRSRDLFLYNTVTRTKIEKSSSGGGSSTHTSSDGSSMGGGGGKF